MVLHGQNTSSGAGSNTGLAGKGGRAGLGLYMENMGSTGLQEGSDGDLKIRGAKELDLWRNDNTQVNILQVCGNGGGELVPWVILGRKLGHKPAFSIFSLQNPGQLSFSQKL